MPTWTPAWNEQRPEGDNRKRRLQIQPIWPQAVFLQFWSTALQHCRAVGCTRSSGVRSRDVPPAWVDLDLDRWSARDLSFLSWLRWASWGRCRTCSARYHRTLSQGELLSPESAAPRLDQPCWTCAHGAHKYEAPTPDDFPEVLRQLPPAVHVALRPLTLHQGSPRKHRDGYHRKDKLSHVSWAKEPVWSAVQQHGAAAEAAYRWLLDNNAAYAAYVREHDAVLARAEAVSLPPSAILEPYLECALWPVLYFRADLAESHRARPPNWQVPFKKRERCERQVTWDSAKAAFMAKVRSDTPDYGEDFSLIQFQFDRYLFRCVLNRGSAAETAGRHKETVLADKSWTPGYWKKHHAVLLDVVHQIGAPHLFLTVAPYEWSFPFPYWIDRAAEALGKDRTGLPGQETLAVAHALHQLILGFCSGATGRHEWKYHLFGDAHGGANPVQAVFGRFEFQDGGKQHTYGKGRSSLHVHALFWLAPVRAVALESLLCAHVPTDDPQLETVVRKVQAGSKDRAPVHEEPSEWRWHGRTRKWFLRLYKTRQFELLGLRPFVTAILRIFRCMTDVQWWTTGYPLLRYVAGYASKYAEAWGHGWLDNDSFHAALNVAKFWKPGACEMIMVLSRDSMVMTTVSSDQFFPARFGEPGCVAREAYESRSAELESTTFLEWLRAHRVEKDDRGEPCVRKRQCKGIFAVGVRYVKFGSDTFFWQWLQMYTPFRTTAALCPPEMGQVRPDLSCLAAALHLHPNTWDNADWVQEYLRSRGHKEAYVRSEASRILGLAHMCRRMIAGTLPTHAVTTTVHSAVDLVGHQQVTFDALCTAASKVVGADDVDAGGQGRAVFVTGSAPEAL